MIPGDGGAKGRGTAVTLRVCFVPGIEFEGTVTYVNRILSLGLLLC